MNEDQTLPISIRSPKCRIPRFVVPVILAIGIIVAYWIYTQRPQAFIRHWSARFSAINNLEAAKRIDQSEPVILRIFASGEWVIATCEYSCCDGAGFDATVIRDSTGAIYTNIGHNFCGIEGLGDGLGEHSVPATSLPAFYSGLSQLNLQRR